MGSEFLLSPKSGGADFERPPAGNHPAVCVAVVSMGTHRRQGFQGKPDYDTRMIYLAWELVTKRQTTNKNLNHVVGQWLAMSLGEKATLRKWLQARSGKQITADYDITQELGQPCMINLVEARSGEKVFVNIDGLAPMPELPPGFAYPAPQNKPVAISLQDLLSGTQPPDWLPYLYGRPLIERIRESAEFRQLNPAAPAPATQQAGNPIPF